MAWSSGIPTVASAARPASSTEGETGGPRARPSAWVPPSGQMAPGPDATRGDVLLYLLAGTGFLLVYLLLVILSALEELGRGGSSVATLLELRNVALGLGFVGLVLVGFAFWFFPTFSGIPIRPRAAVRVHLGVETASLAAYVLCGLAYGSASASANLFLIIAAGSYALVTVPILVALYLAIGDWRAGLL
jgi:hypothetical protein